MEQELINKLCCPVCRGRLLNRTTSMVCMSCQSSYPIVKGRPLLVPLVVDKGPNSDALIASADALVDRDTVTPREDRHTPNIEDLYFKELFPQFDRRMPHWSFLGSKINEMVKKIPESSYVLDIGAGECKYGALLSHCTYVSTDLVFSSDKHDFSHINVVADASTIPFRDHTFDIALNLVVLEHVPDPGLSIREMGRILKPGGLAFALIPLVRPEHLTPFDFYRFTRFGIKKLFENNGFQIDQIEGSNGALWTSVYYTSLFTKTQPLKRYGHRSFRGLFWNRFWSFILWPLVVYARRSDQAYSLEFPIYFWVQAVKNTY
jgi:SAM-dependent methyltransferase/uncharacterized protein YbaR (Trm112 family)